MCYHSPEMIERKNFNINEIEREFFIKGPVEVVCKPKAYNRWCTLPYPNHKSGCPNFGEREDCPPNAPYFLDLYEPKIYLLLMGFNFEEYLEKKRKLHPDWTVKALLNNRHYQSHLRSNLKSFSDSQINNSEFKNYQPIFNGEAMGINFQLTCQKIGIELEWPPRKRMYRIAVLAKPLKNL